jgi:hypothetical protein
VDLHHDSVSFPLWTFGKAVFIQKKIPVLEHILYSIWPCVTSWVPRTKSLLDGVLFWRLEDIHIIMVTVLKGLLDIMHGNKTLECVYEMRKWILWKLPYLLKISDYCSSYRTVSPCVSWLPYIYRLSSQNTLILTLSWHYLSRLWFQIWFYYFTGECLVFHV